MYTLVSHQNFRSFVYWEPHSKKKKVKCSGQQPKCDNCRHTGGNCEYKHSNEIFSISVASNEVPVSAQASSTDSFAIFNPFPIDLDQGCCSRLLRHFLDELSPLLISDFTPGTNLLIRQLSPLLPESRSVREAMCAVSISHLQHNQQELHLRAEDFKNKANKGIKGYMTQMRRDVGVESLAASVLLLFFEVGTSKCLSDDVLTTFYRPFKVVPSKIRTLI